MKLQNKKTGEVGKILKQLSEDNQIEVITDNKLYVVKSLAELNAEWEDYEEPKEYWYIDCDGDVYSSDRLVNFDVDRMSNINNCFESVEEAEKAVEKLKTWKRLKDKGFRFDGWSSGLGKNAIYTIFWSGNDGEFDLRKDLDLLFGGEE